jgi:hypothetical protein
MVALTTLGFSVAVLRSAFHSFSIALGYGDTAIRAAFSFYEFVHRDDLDSFLKLGSVQWEKVSEASMLRLAVFLGSRLIMLIMAKTCKVSDDTSTSDRLPVVTVSYLHSINTEGPWVARPEFSPWLQRLQR